MAGDSDNGRREGPLPRSVILSLAAGYLGMSVLMNLLNTLLVFFYLPPDTAGLPTLESILLIHVVPGRLYADEVIAAGQLTSVGGKVLQVTTQGGNDAHRSYLGRIGFEYDGDLDRYVRRL